VFQGQWNAVSRTLSEGVLVVDANQQIVFANDSARNFVNLPDLTGHRLDQVDWSLAVQPLVDEILAGRAESLSQMVAHDDRAFAVNLRGCQVDSWSGAVIVLSDVTELQRLGRVRRDFVANISHELRTPVTSLQLLADTLANELPAGPSTAMEWLEKIRGQIQLLQQLTTELMDLALIESGQMPIKLVDTPVLSLANAVVDLLRPQANSKRIAISVQIGADVRALADPEGLRRVLSNLVHNAIKFTPVQGQINVVGDQVGDNIEIQVADTGIGIPANDLPRIFERFYKVDRARAQSQVRGTGLGLAIARHIVEGHGGKIWAESTEGKGSTFHISLPAAG
jgi:two-component system phosphate regulon sensor histidine kinase PhoR